MARNEEKQLGRLNRYYLKRQHDGKKLTSLKKKARAFIYIPYINTPSTGLCRQTRSDTPLGKLFLGKCLDFSTQAPAPVLRGTF